MNNNPQRECSEDPNIHTYGEYTRCLNSKLSNPYTVGLEIPLKQNIGMILGIFAMVILILLALHYFRIITLPLPVPQKK